METLVSAHGRQAAFHIGEPSEIATARRAACDLARTLGLNETVTGEIAIVVTEAGTNISKYAGDGEILLRKAVRHDGAVGIEILALDKGPGIPHLSRFMQDGHSTGRSYGIGLGTMARLADQFDIYTASGQGTAICLSFWCKPDAWSASGCDIGIVCRPVAGETICGDAWHVMREDGKVTVLLADGLRHGPMAAVAFAASCLRSADAPLGLAAQTLANAQEALQQAPGTALGVACLDIDAGRMAFAGIGNIAGYTLDHGKMQHSVSHDAVVGSMPRQVGEFGSRWSSEALLIMHGDGIRTGWDLALYPGLALSYPALIAAVLYRDFSRGNDDATVFVCRQVSGNATGRGS
jgi:anti-sigma regulatory factor (Ser/Thr protein kinase)